MDGGDDWDLAAVVRGCCSRAKPAAAAASDPLLSPVFFGVEENRGGPIVRNHFFPDLSKTGNFVGLEEFYNPFLIRQSRQQLPVQPTQRPQGDELKLGATKKPHRPAPTQPPRSKRR